jgi:hypothetical protein
MGNSNDTGFRGEHVISASRYERPKQGGGGPCTHSGTVVHTREGNSYLIHNTPSAGVVATSANNMSSLWMKTEDISVHGNKTVGDAMRGGYTSGSARLGKIGEYIGSGTCKGTANGVRSALM